MALIYSLKYHTLVQLLKIELAKTKGKSYIYEITTQNGDVWLEERPENWFEMLYELGKEDLIYETLRRFED